MVRTVNDAIKMDGRTFHLERLDAHQWNQVILEEAFPIVMVCDTNTRVHCLPLVIEKLGIEKHLIFEIPEGEHSKSLEQCQKFWEFAAENNLGRQGLIIAIGGGVVLDFAGFCASVWKRGIAYISIPTSIMAQADAAIGAKTGVNFHQYKNMLGSFYPPLFVITHFDFLKTLPSRHIKNGKVEIIKHLLLQEENPWQSIEKLQKNFDFETWNEVILNSIKFKSSITLEDPFDQGKRKILNLGHTMGHALESLAFEKEQDLLHGEAVAMGIWIESWLGKELLGYSSAHFDQLYTSLSPYFPDPFNFDIQWSEIHKYLLADKKNSNEKVQFALLEKPGHPIWNVELDVNQLEIYFTDRKIKSIFTP
ncbi:MAG: 3-dehydroquinate synthase [Saprospiraceae bacterium]|nr:3-dehydroquinate synthase [Saprospiraceae bacterium]